MKRSGFFLIEYIIVIAAIAFIATLSFYKLPFLFHAHARMALEEMRMVCWYAQQCARTTGTLQPIEFEPSLNRYQWNGTYYQLPQGISFGVLPDSLGPPSRPTHPLSSPVTFENNRLEMYADGIMKSGSVYVLDKKTNTLYALTCDVSSISHIRLYKYQDSVWKLI
jgi:hypothetical protein